MAAKKKFERGELKKALFMRFKKGMSLAEACADLGISKTTHIYKMFDTFSKVSQAKRKAANPKYEAVAVMPEQPKPAAQGGTVQMLMGSPSDIAEVLRRMK